MSDLLATGHFRGDEFKKLLEEAVEHLEWLRMSAENGSPLDEFIRRAERALGKP